MALLLSIPTDSDPECMGHYLQCRLAAETSDGLGIVCTKVSI